MDYHSNNVNSLEGQEAEIFTITRISTISVGCTEPRPFVILFNRASNYNLFYASD